LQSDSTGWFSSNRSVNEAAGDDDIYHFTDRTPRDKVVNYFLTGVTYSATTSAQNLLPNTSLTLYNQAGEELETVTSNSQASFAFTTPVTIGENLRIVANQPDHIEHSMTVSTGNMQPSDAEILAIPGDSVEYMLKTDVVLQPNIFSALEEGEEEVELEGITYEFDRSELTAEARQQLDKLVEYMQSKPDLKVELGSHTDVIGPERYNMRLSEKRSASAVDYIVSKGIDKSRIVAQGYGETDLKIENARTEEEHRQNRRTTIRIID
jgi:peptidoglycan-associated lipoprotein